MYKERERGGGVGRGGGCPSTAGAARKCGSMWKMGNKPREHRGWRGGGELTIITVKGKQNFTRPSEWCAWCKWLGMRWE